MTAAELQIIIDGVTRFKSVTIGGQIYVSQDLDMLRRLLQEKREEEARSTRGHPLDCFSIVGVRR